MSERSEKIAQLNDMLRQNMGLKGEGKVLTTQGFNGLEPEDQQQFIGLVRTFNSFSEDNDPYREHDFGAVTHNGNKVYWKIDYYDPTLTMGSEDPTDPEKTVRVMTIMLAAEY